MKREVVGSMSEWAGILKDLFRQFEDGSLTLEQVKMFGKHQNPFEVLSSIQEWQGFYKKYFGMSADFSTVSIPEHRAGFDRLIIVAKGLTLNRVYNVCAEHFSCWRYADDLDEAIPTNDRTAIQPYAVWFRDCREADEELKNLSADQLAEKRIPGITLLERMLYELKRWDETGEHLDLENVTLCTGSRGVDRGVPRACWRGGGFRVGWRCSSRSRSLLRSRAAVPLSR